MLITEINPNVGLTEMLNEPWPCLLLDIIYWNKKKEHLLPRWIKSYSHLITPMPNVKAT
jgi:hypothetical protein